MNSLLNTISGGSLPDFKSRFYHLPATELGVFNLSMSQFYYL